jgi:hypothetical protein
MPLAKPAKVGYSGVTCLAGSCMSTSALHEPISAPHGLYVLFVIEVGTRRSMCSG